MQTATTAKTSITAVTNPTPPIEGTNFIGGFPPVVAISISSLLICTVYVSPQTVEFSHIIKVGDFIPSFQATDDKNQIFDIRSIYQALGDRVPEMTNDHCHFAPDSFLQSLYTPDVTFGMPSLTCTIRT